MSRARRVAALVGLLLSAPGAASAGGLWFSDRGVRPMGRGGAFVAGADDLGAVWYNPAGITDASNTLLFDATWLRFSNEYTRELYIRDADNVVKRVPSTTVQGSSPILPLPTMMASYGLLDGKLTIAGGVFAPYVALASYDKKTPDGQPSPARYTLGSFDGSTLALPGVWIAGKPLDWLQLGAGVHALMGTFVSQITFSAAPQDRLLSAPEDPDFDASSEMRVGPIFAPTANFGAIVTPDPHVRIGAAYQLPTKISSDATIKVRLPSSAVFDGAAVVGDKAHVSFTLPDIFRVGVEGRFDAVRVEVAYAREFWSKHDEIVAEPTGIEFRGITGGPEKVNLPVIRIPRKFRDASSYRLGGEVTFDVKGYKLGARAGIAYEQSAVPPEYLSLSSLDFDKTTLAVGGSLYIGKRWRFDGVIGHIFAAEANVQPEEAKIGRINPLQKNAPFESVNGGRYRARADLLGIGLQYDFGAAEERRPAPPPPPKGRQPGED